MKVWTVKLKTTVLECLVIVVVHIFGVFEGSRAKSATRIKIKFAVT